MTRLASTRPSIVVVVVVTFRSTSPTSPMLASASTFTGVKVAAKATVAKTARRANVVTRAGQYDDELLQTAVRRVFFHLYSIVSSRARVTSARQPSIINHIALSVRIIDRSIDAWMMRVARRRMRVIARETNRGIFTSKRIPRSSRAEGSPTTGRRRRRRDDASVAGRPCLGSWSGLSLLPFPHIQKRRESDSLPPLDVVDGSRLEKLYRD